MPERRRRRQRHVLGPDSCEREETGAGIHIPVERLRPSTSSRRPVYVPPSSPVSSTDILTPLPLAAQSRQDEPFELSGWSSSSLLLNRATTTHESSPSSSDVMRGCVGGRAAQVLDVLTPCPAPPNTSNSSCGVITNRPVFSTHPVSSSSSLAKRTRHKRHRRRREGTRDQQREGPRLPPLIRPATSLSVRSSVVPKRQEWPDEGRSGQAELWLAVHDDVAATVLDVEDGSACTHEHDRMSSTNGGNGVSISFGTVLAAANASASGPGSGAHSEGGAQNGRGKIAYECAEVSCAGRRWCWRQARPAMWTVFALVFPRGPGPSEGTETNGVRRACADNDRLGTGYWSRASPLPFLWLLLSLTTALFLLSFIVPYCFRWSVVAQATLILLRLAASSCTYSSIRDLVADGHFEQDMDWSTYARCGRRTEPSLGAVALQLQGQLVASLNSRRYVGPWDVLDEGGVARPDSEAVLRVSLDGQPD
uniref:Uncharacterized protein n=1 Tax=Mycena chlorophos TaxID=658473 RepID=A0ABQ0LLC7_MYCCL|nr:predicted protein [Mycena chlorophos]